MISLHTQSLKKYIQNTKQILKSKQISFLRKLFKKNPEKMHELILS